MSYRPLEGAEAFHRSDAAVRVITGALRSGKTTAALADLAWAVTGSHPCRRFPEKGRACLVGYDHQYVSRVLAEPLLWPDAGEPLIPKEAITSVRWLSKRDNLPLEVTIGGGWTIRFLSSKQEPPRGLVLDYALVSEFVESGRWYDEMLLATRRNGGAFVAEFGDRDAVPRILGPVDRNEVYRMRLEDNVHIPAKAKADFAEFMAI